MTDPGPNSDVPNDQSKKGQIPSLDGLRAIAFGIVFLSHLPGVKGFPGGFGVTIFFFLSGFLITTLMRKEFTRTGTISIRQFYTRRVLRIFPPMYITLIIGCVLAFTDMLPGTPTLQGILAEAFHYTNYFLIEGFKTEVVPGQRVFWSLAVEEHFYLIFPVLSLFAFTRISLKQFTVVLCVVAALILSWRLFLVLELEATQLRIQYGTDTRIDSILFGAVMAIGFNPVLDPPRLQKPRTALVVFVVCIIGLLATIASRNFLFRETIRYSLQGLLLIPIYYVLISRPDWPIIRWLNLRWVQFFGVLTYSLYLVHDMAILGIQKAFPDAGALVVAVAGIILSVVYAYAIHVLVEKPLQHVRHRFRK